MKKLNLFFVLSMCLALASCGEKNSFFTITWTNYDGSILETDANVPYGSTPSYDGVAPTKPATAQYSYVWNGWSPEITAVTGDAVYVAIFSESTNEYTITWENYDGTVLEVDRNVPYGSTPSYDGATPTKAGNEQYSYTWSGWSPSVSSVTGDATYIAMFSESTNEYTITWENYDGTVLEVDRNVPYGLTPSYDSVAPTKPATAQYSYTWNGWLPEITAVAGDKTYIAQFSNTVNRYTITWDIEGAKTTEVYSYGEIPSYKGSEPVKDKDAQYIYKFSGWSPEITAVAGDKTYFAQFSSENILPKIYETDGMKYVYIGSFPQTLYTPSSENEKIELDMLYREKGNTFAYNSMTLLRYVAYDGVSNSKTYYFKYEPIRWDIVSEENGVYTVMTHVCLTFSTLIMKTIKTGWESSNLRKYLNGDFLNYLKVNEKLPTYILDTINSNDFQSSNIERTVDNYMDEPSPTTDKVYLFSYSELNALKDSGCFSSEPIMSDYARKVTRYRLFYYNDGASHAIGYENAWYYSDIFYPSRSTTGVRDGVSGYYDAWNYNEYNYYYGYWGLMDYSLVKFSAGMLCKQGFSTERWIPVVPVMRIADNTD